MARTTPLSLTSLLILPAIIALLAPPCSACNILYSGESLSEGEALTDVGNSGHSFIMQEDCNLVLYENGKPLWASQTYGRGPGCRLVMQRDGNLVIYNGKNCAVWASGSYRGGNGNYVLVLQKDRNVVIYGGAIWATGTNRKGTPDVVISTADVVKSKNSTVTTAPFVVVDAAAAVEVKSRKIAMVVN